MSADILVGTPFLPARSKHDESPILPEVSLSMLENWLSSYSRPSQSAAPIVASTITIEAIQNLLHTTGFPIEAPSNQDVFFGPFEDTQFDLVVDVETSDECLEGDMKFKDLDTCSEYDYGGSDLSEDEFHFLQGELPLSPDSPLLSDCELDLSNDSGIEAEMDDLHDSQDEKEDKSEQCHDGNPPEESDQQKTPAADEKNKSNNLNEASLRESNGKLQETNVVEKIKDDEQEDDPPVFHCQYLWEFLHHLLSEKHHKYIVWKNQSKGVFHLIDHNGVARLWGIHKKRKNMTYEKLSRALRYYYSKNILRKVPGQRLTYKFVRNLSGKKYPL